MVERAIWCHFWFSSSLLEKMVCSPAVSCFPLYKSIQPPSYTLGQDVAEAKTTRGDFPAWNFPTAIVSISYVRQKKSVCLSNCFC